MIYISCNNSLCASSDVGSDERFWGRSKDDSHARCSHGRCDSIVLNRLAVGIPANSARTGRVFYAAYMTTQLELPKTQGINMSRRSYRYPSCSDGIWSGRADTECTHSMLYQGFVDLRRSKEVLHEVRLKIAEDGVFDQREASFAFQAADDSVSRDFLR